MRILVTGAAGFVGPFLCRRLVEEGYAVRAAVRRHEDLACLPRECEPAVVTDLNLSEARRRLVTGVDGVVHLAAKVHDISYRSADDLEAYVAANTAITADLARAAAAAGAGVFVFASSIKVNGESTAPGRPFTAADIPDPQGAYAISKWRAEQALQELARETGIRAVAVRPPLVYGPRVKGNFLRLMRLVKLGLPLPLGSATNRRSLLYVGNLADLLVRCLRPVDASVVVASDGAPVSTRQLVIELAEAMDSHTRLLPFPVSLLRVAAWIAGRAEEVERLLGSLEIDSSDSELRLAWQPPFTRRRALEETAAWCLAGHAQSKKAA